MNYSVLQVSNYFCILWAVLWNGVIISYTQEEAVILHHSIKERKDSKSLKSNWMYIDRLNEKRCSNFRASLCPFHIFISFYLKVASSHVTLFYSLYTFYENKCLNKWNIHSSNFLLYFAVPERIDYKAVLSLPLSIFLLKPDITVFLSFYIWVIENW